MIKAMDEDGKEHELEEFMCEPEHPWHAGMDGSGKLVLHPHATVGEDGVRRCPTCGLKWERQNG